MGFISVDTNVTVTTFDNKTDIKTFKLSVKPSPALSPQTLVNVNEDEAITSVVSFIDIIPLELSISTFTGSPRLSITSAPTGSGLPSGQFHIPLQAISAHLNGTTSFSLTVRDVMGPGFETVITVPVTINPVNDPPTLSFSALPSPTVDPSTGAAVAFVNTLGITDTIDGSVLLSKGGVALSCIATVGGGMNGIDLLSLHGDATYRVDGTNMVAITGGAVVATWNRLNGTQQLAINLAAGQSAATLGQLARLLRYGYALSPNTPRTRTIDLQITEPDVNGTATVSCPCQVRAINRAPVVTLRDIELEPSRSRGLDLAVQDGDIVTITIASPPVAGTITPTSYRGSAAGAAAAFTYTHTAGDVSDDRVTLAVSDEVNPPVQATAAISVRLRPDRVAIISDPLFEAIRGQSVSRVIRTAPAENVTLSLLPYGHPMPPLGKGVVLTGSTLSIDWTQVPTGTSWLAVTVQAQSSDTTLTPVARRSTIQPMLIRVLDQAPGGTAN